MLSFKLKMYKSLNPFALSLSKGSARMVEGRDDCGGEDANRGVCRAGDTTYCTIRSPAVPGASLDTRSDRGDGLRKLCVCWRDHVCDRCIWRWLSPACKNRSPATATFRAGTCSGGYTRGVPRSSGPARPACQRRRA